MAASTPLDEGIDPTAIRVGTIIIFHSPHDYAMPIVHRVVAVDNEGGSLFFETKGDHNSGPDGWRVPGEDLIGVYVVKIPYVGIISLELRGPLGVSLIILLVALIVAIEYKESKSSAKKTGVQCYSLLVAGGNELADNGGMSS